MEPYDQTQLLWSIVKILRDDTVVGTGFVVSDRFIATCAHVVDAVHAKPGDSIKIQFLKRKTASPFVYVEPGLWRDSSKEDVAILRLNESLPKGIAPVALSSSKNFTRALELQEFCGYGFPEGEQEDGLWAEITVVGQLPGSERLQVKSLEIEPGFSGGPILDLQRGEVVGMIQAIRDMDPETGRNQDTAFANPAVVIRAILPEIPPIEATKDISIEVTLMRNKDDLVEALENCSTLETIDGRNQCKQRLPRSIRIRIADEKEQRVHLTIFVDICSDFEGGIESLVEAVNYYEGDNKSMKRVRECAEKLLKTL